MEKTRVQYKTYPQFKGVGYEYTVIKSHAWFELTTYYLDGKRHRTDGPAMIYDYGSRTVEYYYLHDTLIYQDGLELFHKLNSIPLKDLPKYLNHVPDLHLSIIKERLNANL